MVLSGERPARRRAASPVTSPRSRSTVRKSAAIRSIASGGRARVREIVEEPEERAGRPFRRESQQVEEVPYLDRMDLHRGCRQQHEPLGACLERPHQREQGVRPAFPRRAGGAAAGVMRLVEHHQVPGLRLLQQRRAAVAPADEMARSDDGRLAVPLAPADLPFMPPAEGGRGIPDESPPRRRSAS